MHSGETLTGRHVRLRPFSEFVLPDDTAWSSTNLYTDLTGAAPSAVRILLHILYVVRHPVGHREQQTDSDADEFQEPKGWWHIQPIFHTTHVPSGAF